MPGRVRTPASLDDIVGDGKTHILIRTRKENIEHKYEDIVEKPKEKDKIAICYWAMARPPKTNIIGWSGRNIEGNKIMFTDGTNVIGEGTIIEVKPTTNLNPGEIVFMPLKRVSYPQPKKAPTRGFIYIEKPSDA